MEFVGLGFRSTDAASDAVKCDSMFIVQVAPCPQHTPGMHALTALTASRSLCLCLCSYHLGTLRWVHLVPVPAACQGLARPCASIGLACPCRHIRGLYPVSLQQAANLPLVHLRTRCALISSPQSLDRVLADQQPFVHLGSVDPAVASDGGSLLRRRSS